MKIFSKTKNFVTETITLSTSTTYIEHSPREASSHTANQEIPAFYETRKFITMFTTAFH
jgi:hypothetical protein